MEFNLRTGWKIYSSFMIHILKLEFFPPSFLQFNRLEEMNYLFCLNWTAAESQKIFCLSAAQRK